MMISKYILKIIYRMVVDGLAFTVPRIPKQIGLGMVIWQELTSTVILKFKKQN